MITLITRAPHSPHPRSWYLLFLCDLNGEIYFKSPAVWDVNADDEINVLNLVQVANALRQIFPGNSRLNVNGDGQVSILDLVAVANHLFAK